MLITYNVNLAYKESCKQGAAERIADFLLECDADFVLLQEYNVCTFPELHNKLSIRYMYSCPYEYVDRFKVVYSKYPISEYGQLKDKDFFSEKRMHIENRKYIPICGMVITARDDKFYVVNCHL